MSIPRRHEGDKRWFPPSIDFATMPKGGQHVTRLVLQLFVTLKSPLRDPGTILHPGFKLSLHPSPRVCRQKQAQQCSRFHSQGSSELPYSLRAFPTHPTRGTPGRQCRPSERKNGVWIVRVVAVRSGKFKNRPVDQSRSVFGFLFRVRSLASFSLCDHLRSILGFGAGHASV